MSITKSTVNQLKKLLDKREISSEELVKLYYEKITKYNKKLNAYITLNTANALQEARNVDLARAKISSAKNPDSLGKLAGIPLAIKDNFCTKGLRTTASSKMLHDFVPVYESTITSRLFAAGGIMLGKTNLDEFAMGSATKTSWFGHTISPIISRVNPQTHLTAGGSSGGSSAAVAGDLAAAAIGSDTGGSIRQPAGLVGSVGVKPTYGLGSRYGMIAFASSLDQPGPITKDVTDAALMLEVMLGYDDKDATSLRVTVPEYSKNLSSDIKGLRVGLIADYGGLAFSPELHKMQAEARKMLEAGGAIVKDIELSHLKHCGPVYYILASAEAASNLARFDGIRYGYNHQKDAEINEHQLKDFDLEQLYMFNRQYGFGSEVKRRILLGTYVTSSGRYEEYFLLAKRVQQIVRREFRQAFADVDAVVMFCTPTPAFALDHKQTIVEGYLNDIFTVPANIAGVPAISLPFSVEEKSNLPLGLQVVAPWLGEQVMLNIAYFLEQNAPFKQVKLQKITDID